MALTKFKLGSLIEQCDARNVDGSFTVDEVRGISTGKEFIKTKANMNDVSLISYKIVKINEFAYVADTSRRGDKIALAFNSGKEILISSIYTVFRVSRPDLLNEEYLFMFFNRPEFDRYSRYNSWGSARETFSWEDMCDIEIELPHLDIQNRFAAIYNALVANQQSYELGLDDLKLVIDLIIEKYKHDANKISLGELLREYDTRNSNNSVADVDGVNKDKRFMPSVASGVDLAKYKLVQHGSFACNLMHVGRDVVVPIAYNSTTDFRLVSPAYMVLKPINEVVLPEYVLMWMSRSETDRHAWFMSDSSVRSGMEKSRFFEMVVPIPPMNVQESLVNIHKVLDQRIAINEQLKTQIKDICPALIRGSLEYGG